jgi:hypothetical protein
MKRQVIGLVTLTALTTLTTLPAACGAASGGSSSGAQNGGSAGTSGGAPAPARGPASATTSTADPVGVVAVTLRGTNGSDRVSCGNINTEFAVYPESGSIAWAASPRDTPIDLGNPQVRAPLSGVTVTPAHGVLGPGQRTVVHVTGSVAAPAKTFWVWVTAPDSTGLSGRDVVFTCIGR